MREAVDLVKNKVIPILHNQIILSDREGAILGIFFRVHVLCSSQTRLTYSKDFNAVANNCRTLYELLLDLKLLSANDSTDEDIKRFYAFPEIDRFGAAEKVSGFQAKNPGVETHTFFDNKIRQSLISDKSRRDDVIEKVRNLWGEKKGGKLNWPKHWSGFTIRDRAKKFGAISEQEYLEVFWMLSSYVHSGSGSYAGLPARTLELIYGMSIDMSRKMYLESLIICSKILSLSRYIKDFNQIVEFIRDAPDKILIKNALDKMYKSDNDKQ